MWLNVKKSQYEVKQIKTIVLVGIRANCIYLVFLRKKISYFFISVSETNNKVDYMKVFQIDTRFNLM